MWRGVVGGRVMEGVGEGGMFEERGGERIGGMMEGRGGE